MERYQLRKVIGPQPTGIGTTTMYESFDSITGQTFGRQWNKSDALSYVRYLNKKAEWDAEVSK